MTPTIACTSSWLSSLLARFDTRVDGFGPLRFREEGGHGNVHGIGSGGQAIVVSVNPSTARKLRRLAALIESGCVEPVVHSLKEVQLKDSILQLVFRNVDPSVSPGIHRSAS